jgi:hypothetical protein
MRIDCSPAERFLAYADGEAALDAVWDHPAYDVVRAHAELLGRDLSRSDVARAIEGEETAFSRVEGLDEHRERIGEVLDHVRANEDAWTETIERHLARVTPDADLSTVDVYLGIGYSLGVGLESGAYLNLNAPLFLDAPREVLYTALHESSHVVYERTHHARSEIGPDDFETREGQQRVFDTVFHTEAFATYTPLALREADGDVGGRDHPIPQDYAVRSDPERLAALVAEYVTVREQLRAGPVDRERFLGHLFGGSRLPYRVGCALLARIEEQRGIEAVREAFYLDPADFHEHYDPLLDEFRADT